MDGERFDEIAKALARVRSRRTVARGLAAGLLGALAGVPGRRGVGAQDGEDACPAKVGICHRTGSAKNPVRYIEVCVDALSAHAAHGDVVCGEDEVLNADNCTCDPLCPDGLSVIDGLCASACAEFPTCGVGGAPVCGPFDNCHCRPSEESGAGICTRSLAPFADEHCGCQSHADCLQFATPADPVVVCVSQPCPGTRCPTVCLRPCPPLAG